MRLPGVFSAPIRNDVVNFVHRDMAKNLRQPYSVAPNAGMQATAESWGTGRAVARVPRVTGGGTHRSGQAAYGNMCRGGRMFGITKTWRRWHRKVSISQRRVAVTACLAASAITPLVLARGHRLSAVGEIPLVLSDDLQKLSKTKDAKKVLAEHGAYEDVQKVVDSKNTRAGKGKMRGRRFTQRRGPLIVYAKNEGLVNAFRNVPGVELCNVDKLNVLQLAPGGHIGRFVIWSQSAFERLQPLFGSIGKLATLKKNYTISRPIVTNTDITRLINSDEIQSVVRPAKQAVRVNHNKRNAFRSPRTMFALNPYAAVQRRESINTERAALARRAAHKASKRNSTKEERAAAKKLKLASRANFAQISRDD